MYRLFFFLVLFSADLVAQAELSSKLAREVCDCLEKIEDESPRLYARNCLKRVAAVNREGIAKEFRYSFDPLQREDLDLLTGYLAEALAGSCPFLQTFYEPEQEVELRWSDAKMPASRPEGNTFSKNPAPDPPGQVYGEREPLTIVSGRITARTRKSVTVKTETVEVVVFCSQRQQKLLPQVIGASVRLECQREWRLAEGKVRLVLR